jgi:P27 family predicted phage terminase small subunit
MRGRKPLPRNLKLLKGTDARYIKNSPLPRSPTALYCPKWLPPYARGFWRRYAPELTRLGLLTVCDVAAFEMLCSAYAHARLAYEALKLAGLFTVDERKLPRKHPAFSMFLNAMREFRTWALEFGMTPSSRGRIDIDTFTDAASEWERLLGPLQPGSN